MSKSVPQKAIDLLKKVEDFSVSEADMHGGAKRHEFFIESMKAGTLKDLLEQCDPSDANSMWDAERQKAHPDSRDLARFRRAVAWMSSMGLGIRRRYEDNELADRLRGRASSFRRKYMLLHAGNSISMAK